VVALGVKLNGFKFPKSLHKTQPVKLKMNTLYHW